VAGSKPATIATAAASARQRSVCLGGNAIEAKMCLNLRRFGGTIFVPQGDRKGIFAGMATATAPPSAIAERQHHGIDERHRLPLAEQADWRPSTTRADPVDILVAQGKTRLAELLPVRYARMKADPFAFLRGAAAVMAADLGALPASRLRVQACGDCHLANFGAYATPEGTPVFDINDFDETLPAPFEWDVKRLASSLVLAGRIAGLGAGDCRRLARGAAVSYRATLAQLASMPPLDAWNVRVDLSAAIAGIEKAKLRRRLEQRLAAVLDGAAEHFGLVESHDGKPRIRDKPPLVHHLARHELRAHRAFSSYADSLAADRRVLLQRYRLRDVAFKVVGVGSVGTFCAIGLLTSDAGAPLLLQIKEAQESVLAPYAGASEYAVHGERVVVGQRLLQAATDIFLGWTAAPLNGRFFYVRRLKDARLADLGTSLEAALPFYARLCGHTLARAHGRSGDALMIAAYLGDTEEFDHAIAEFATAYADQSERDWRCLQAAIAAGRIAAGNSPGLGRSAERTGNGAAICR
jgi:uncharacterized protein (DUF2252 family)